MNKKGEKKKKKIIVDNAPKEKLFTDFKIEEGASKKLFKTFYPTISIVNQHIDWVIDAIQETDDIMLEERNDQRVLTRNNEIIAYVDSHGLLPF